MKAFNFKRFSVAQSKDVFRVGTDAVLLGALCSVDHQKTVLEVGTGTGIISLMIAQRNTSAMLIAIDINPDAAELATKNFKESPFSSRLNCLGEDFNNFSTETKFDLIVCNPPYFAENDSDKDVIARQQTALTFESFIRNSHKLLSENGIISVIIPSESKDLFLEKCDQFNLHLQRIIVIAGIKNGKPKRVILEVGSKQKETQIENFTIESSPRVYSKQYLDLTQDFHLFETKA